MDEECIHGLTELTCSICKPKLPTDRSLTSTDEWDLYRERYGSRPETFEAYVDVWKRLSGARQFPGGWTMFSRAANAEPAIDLQLVARAEELMRLGGYEADEKQPRIGRRWWPKQGLAK